MARRFGVRFQRRLGQHFLADRGQLERIVEDLELEADDRMIEVGAGLGVLTAEMAASVDHVTAVEIDPACISALRFTLRRHANVRIVEGDILAQDVSALEAGRYRVVGNIPYYLTGALAVHLLDQPRPPARIDLLVQREVAERLSAPPGGWSLATLGVRVYGRPELRLFVPAQAFLPPPRVGSALLRIVPDPEPALPRSQLRAFFAFARPFFQARRKQLVQVASQTMGADKATARKRLQSLGIDPSRRPETLDLEEWKRLFVALADAGLRQ